MPTLLDAQLFKTAFESAQASNAALASTISATEESSSVVPQSTEHVSSKEAESMSAPEPASTSSTVEASPSTELESANGIHGDTVRKACQSHILRRVAADYLAEQDSRYTNCANRCFSRSCHWRIAYGHIRSGRAWDRLTRRCNGQSRRHRLDMA